MATRTIRLGQRWRTLEPGQIARLVGTAPPDLRTYELVANAVLADDAPVIDHAKDLAWQAHVAALEANPPRPAAPLTRGDIAKRFGWRDGQIDAAISAGFPQASGYQLVRAGFFGGQSRVPTWRAQDVDRWVETLGELGFARKR